jgi:protein tyrosine phosphatase (PTP) superfamily phosphohydrolase (DUF442 family)
LSFDITFISALSPWPLAFRRYHVSGTTIRVKNAVFENKDSIDIQRGESELKMPSIKDMKKCKIIGVVGIIIFVMVTAASGAEISPADRPAHWAQLIQMQGVPNLHKVSDTLYRSAQPSAEGMKNLKAMGIETIVSLRSFHSDRDEIGDTGLAYEHIYMKAWHPEEEDVVRFLQIVTNPKRTPVLVHCLHGADRTGTMCAVYRIAVQGWGKEEALQEMTQGGFGFHGIWENLIRWIKALDIEGIKKRAGIIPGTEAECGHKGVSPSDKPLAPE